MSASKTSCSRRSALRGRTKGHVIDELASVVAAGHPEIDRTRLVQALEDRERLNSTALGEGVAIPHGKLPGLQRVAVLGTQRSRCGNVHSPSAFDNSFCPSSVVPGRCSAAN